MSNRSTETFDLNQLLHPSEAFCHPSEVVHDPDLTLNEKRAILASWASDACAVEAAPALRQPPGGRAVTVDEVLEALCALDRGQAGGGKLGLGEGSAAGGPSKSLPGA